MNKGGLFLKETVVLRRWGSGTNRVDYVIGTGVHKLTLRYPGPRQNESHEGLTLKNVSF